MKNPSPTHTPFNAQRILQCLLASSLGLTVLPVAAASNSEVQQRSIEGKTYARLPQKPNGSGVAVFHSLSSKAAVGQTATLTLRVDALKGRNTGNITVQADAALGAVSRELKQTLKQDAAVLTLSFTPTRNGLHYVKVFTQQGNRRSAAEIAVQVGTTVQKPAVPGTLVTGANGEKMIEMKSQ
jgi:hypothetical protein